jgi:hypothetical protein
MKKAEQKAINRTVESAMDEFFSNFVTERSVRDFTLENGAKLRNCNARVGRFAKGFVLVSYKTIVAIIDNNGICYDFLRKVYGYTASSAKQINKFCTDYNAIDRLTWREV